MPAREFEKTEYAGGLVSAPAYSCSVVLCICRINLCIRVCHVSGRIIKSHTVAVADGDRIAGDTGPDTAPNRDQRFEQLVDQYQESVLRTCYLYLCDKTLAEDATQDTFLKVYRTMDSFRGESSEKPES